MKNLVSVSDPKTRRTSALLLGAALFASASALALPEVLPQHGPFDAQVSACFVPAQHCAGSIVDAIGRATTTIRFQAYNFTAPAILTALADARKRGVDVQGILDKTNEAARYGGAKAMLAADVPIWIDDRPAIAHNKLIVIDGHLVIGGSYNYTTSAENRNAENVTLIDSTGFADVVTRNWISRQAVSRKLSMPPAPANDP